MEERPELTPTALAHVETLRIREAHGYSVDDLNAWRKEELHEEEISNGAYVRRFRAS